MKSKRMCEINLSNNSRDIKEFFEYFKNTNKIKHSIGPLFKDGRIITQDFDMAETLNELFSSIFSDEDTQNIPTFTATNNIRKAASTITYSNRKKYPIT